MAEEEKKNIADELMEALTVIKLDMNTLKGDVTHVRDTTAATAAQVQELIKNDVKHETLIRASHKRMDKIEPMVTDVTAMKTRVDQIEPKVNEHEAIKNKGLGILTVASFIFGLIGALVSKFLFGSTQ